MSVGLRWFAALLAGTLVVLVTSLGDGTVAVASAQAPAVLTRIGAAITVLGSAGYMLGLSALLALLAHIASRQGLPSPFPRGWDRLAAGATRFFVVVAASGILVQVVKHSVGRARPKLMPSVGAFHFAGPSWAADLASFPSGHATTAFSAAACLGYMLPEARWPLLGLAGLIAASRVLIGAHYPSDVVAGAVLGVSTAFFLRNVSLRPIGVRSC